jgi:hypothetical protein
MASSPGAARLTVGPRGWSNATRCAGCPDAGHSRSILGTAAAVNGIGTERAYSWRLPTARGPSPPDTGVDGRRTAKGLVVQVYDMPGVRWDGEIATLEGLGRTAWFKDSQGNIMSGDQEISTG